MKTAPTINLVEARANAGHYLYLRDSKSRLQKNHRELVILNFKTTLPNSSREIGRFQSKRLRPFRAALFADGNDSAWRGQARRDSHLHNVIPRSISTIHQNLH
jgi:hypothetical protein